MNSDCSDTNNAIRDLRSKYIKEMLYSLGKISEAVKSLVSQYDLRSVRSDDIIKEYLMDLLKNKKFQPMLEVLRCNKNIVLKVVAEDSYLSKTLGKYVNEIVSIPSGERVTCRDINTLENLPRGNYNVVETLTEFGISKEGAVNSLRRIIGKDISVRDLVTDSLRKALVRDYGLNFIESIVRSCSSSYCVATKLSTLWSKIIDAKEVLGWDPRKAFRSALFTPEVVRKASKYAYLLNDLEYEINRPQFSDLSSVKDLIKDWISACLSSEDTRNTVGYIPYFRKVQSESYRTAEAINNDIETDLISIEYNDVNNTGSPAEHIEYHSRQARQGYSRVPAGKAGRDTLKSIKKRRASRDRRKVCKRIALAVALAVIASALAYVLHVGGGSLVNSVGRLNLATVLNSLSSNHNNKKQQISSVHTSATASTKVLASKASKATVGAAALVAHSNSSSNGNVASVNESRAYEAQQPHYVVLNLTPYLENAPLVKNHIFIKSIPKEVKINGIPFRIAFVTGKNYFRDVEDPAGKILTIRLSKPVSATSVYLLLAVHNSCRAHCHKGSQVGEVAVMHSNGDLEKLKLVFGVNIDEWRRGSDTALCHAFPWLRPALSGKVIYITSRAGRSFEIPSTWNMYLIKLKLNKTSSPVTTIYIISGPKKAVPISVYAITLLSQRR